RSLRACIASLPLQSSLMSKTYLKSDHFVGGGSWLPMHFDLAIEEQRADIGLTAGLHHEPASVDFFDIRNGSIVLNYEALQCSARSWLGEADKVLGAFEHDRRVSVVRVGADGFRDENTIHARTEPDQLAVGLAIELVDGATTGSANAADPLKRLAVLSKEF